MKHTLEWKTIKMRGLLKYSISNVGDVRSNFNLKIIEPENNHVTLIRNGSRKKFSVRDLLAATFGENSILLDDRISKEDPPNKMFSKNEDDYGERGGGEWMEIRAEARKATLNRKVNNVEVNYKVVI